MKWEDEKRYTLDEANLALRRQECLENGHSWDAISVLGSEVPLSIVCTNCGANHHVLQPDQLYVEQERLDKVLSMDATQESAYGHGVRDTLKHLGLWA